jgi:hypothetical protein
MNFFRMMMMCGRLGIDVDKYLERIKDDFMIAMFDGNEQAQIMRQMIRYYHYKGRILRNKIILDKLESSRDGIEDYEAKYLVQDLDRFEEAKAFLLGRKKFIHLDSSSNVTAELDKEFTVISGYARDVCRYGDDEYDRPAYDCDQCRKVGYHLDPIHMEVRAYFNATIAGIRQDKIKQEKDKTEQEKELERQTKLTKIRHASTETLTELVAAKT